MLELLLQLLLFLLDRHLQLLAAPLQVVQLLRYLVVFLLAESIESVQYAVVLLRGWRVCLLQLLELFQLQVKVVELDVHVLHLDLPLLELCLHLLDARGRLDGAIRELRNERVLSVS